MEKAKTLLEIARIISGNDDDVLVEIEESIDNIEAYAQEHLEEFEERNISIKFCRRFAMASYSEYFSQK